MSKIVPNQSSAGIRAGGEKKVVRMEMGQDSAKARADLVFVIDTTGSMNDKIDALIETCQSFVDRLATRRIDWVAAVVGFGDLTVEGDRIVATPFSSSAERVKGLLRGLPRYSGGGNEGESSLEAIQAALDLPGYRADAMKVVVLITDEPALQKKIRPSAMTGRLREAGVIAFVLSPKINYFRSMAADTGGEWWNVDSGGDFSRILAVFDKIATRVASTLDAVHRLTGGNVKEYLGLPASSRVE
ncbi:MAG TPA: vWA domain-containing protein [Candidatus Dormibacteraeota bacterium]|nr:vWA domain-containing protein [Candidatus Dormibacteraeota bacterium]